MCRRSYARLNGYLSRVQAFVATGTNLQLHFSANAWSDRAEDRVPTREFVNFDREPGKVSTFNTCSLCVFVAVYPSVVRVFAVAELGRCEIVEVAVLGSSSLLGLAVSVDVKQH